jgi:O-antigen/teichoic acid export membrane protein
VESGEVTQGTEVGAVTRRAARGAAIVAVAQVVGKATTLIWTFVAARELSQADFGAFFFALSLATLISSLAEWGFDSVLVREASVEPHRLGELTSYTVTWQTLIAVPAFLVAGGVAWLSRPTPQSRAALVLVMLAIGLELWSDTTRSVASAALRQATTARALLAQRTFTAVLITAALLLGWGVVGMAAAFLVGAVVGLVLHLRAVRSFGVRPTLLGLDRLELVAFLRRTGTVGLSALVLMLLFRLDAVLLAAMKGDEQVAAYAAAYRLLETVLFLAYALRSSLFPLMSAGGRPDKITRGLERGISAASFFYLPFAAICLVDAEGVLRILYGQRYADASAGALRWLAVSPVLYVVVYLGNSALQAARRARGMLASASAALATNVALNLALIPQLGGTGAAIATTASYAVNAAFVSWFLRESSVRPRLVRPYAQAGPAALLLAGWLWVSPLPTLVEVLLGGAGYVAAWYLLARRTDPEQVEVIRAVLPRGRRVRAADPEAPSAG